MVKVTQHSWLGGVLDRELMGRQDVDRYASGASEIVNFLPQRRGSLAKRPGTDWVCDLPGVGAGQTHFRMIPFGYKTDDGRVLVIATEPVTHETTMKVYGRGGLVATVTGQIPSYTIDDLDALCPAQCGDVLFLASQNHPPAKVSHVAESPSAAYEFEEVAFNPQPNRPEITGYTLKRKYFSYVNYKGSDGYIYDTWDKDHKGRARFASGKTTVIYAASVVDSTGSESSLSVIAPENEDGSENPDGKEQPVDESAETTPIGSDGNVSFSGSVSNASDKIAISFYSPWTESQVITITVKTTLTNFRELRLYKNIAGTYGLIGIAAMNLCAAVENNGGYTYTFVDDNIQPDTSNSPLRDKTVFDKGTQQNPRTDDFPAAVAVYQQRLVWASTRKDPARVWMSATGDLYQHRSHVTIQPDDPIDFILPITRFAKINFIVELRKLLMFSEACEWMVSSNSSSEGVSYDTIQATPHSYIGCEPRLPPIVANTNILFAERTGRAVRSYGYQLEEDGYGGTDVSVFSASVFAGGGRRIVDWTYQQSPQPTVWCVLEDGTLASCVYMPEQQICAWATHRLGGGGQATAIACSWALDDDTSEVFVAVARGGATTLERFRRAAGTRVSVQDSACLDSARVLSSGAAVPQGMVAVQLPDGRKIAGYSFRSSFTSVYPAVSDDRVGAAQFDVRTVQDVALRLRMGVGGTVRAAQAPEELAVPLVRTDVPAADANGMMSFPQVDERVTVAGVNDGDGRVVVEQDNAGPFEILLMETDIDVEVPSED